jgi:hypothetical protein
MFIEWNLQTVYNDVENFSRKQRLRKSASRRRSRLWKVISMVLLIGVVGFATHRLTNLFGPVLQTARGSLQPTKRRNSGEIHEFEEGRSVIPATISR